MTENITAIVIGYLLGSISFAYIAGRLSKGVDIREVGGGNPGALNVFREIGKAEGILVLLADIGKGLGAVLIARWLGVPLVFQLLAGLAAVVGHDWSIFLKFSGGKGAATTLGVLLTLIPWGSPIFVGIGTIPYIITRNPVVSYALAIIFLPFVAWLVYSSGALVACSAFLPLLPGMRHIPTVRRLLITEGKWDRVILMQRRNKS